MPRRPRGHELEEESEHQFRGALPMGWVVRTIDKDYGIDREVEVFHGGEATGYTFKVQLKGTDDEQPSRSIKLSHFRYWASLDVPVLVGLWHTATKRMYAKWAHAHDPGPLRPQQQTTTVRFGDEDELTGWSDRIPDQLELIRDLRTNTVRFPVPVKVTSESHQATARMHAELRGLIRQRNLTDILIVEAQAPIAVVVQVSERRVSVHLPLNVRSFTITAPSKLKAMPFDMGPQTAIDALAMTGLLLAGLGVAAKGGAIAAATLGDSRVASLEDSTGILSEAAFLLASSGHHDVLAGLLARQLNTEGGLRARAEGVLFMAASQSAGMWNDDVAAQVVTGLRSRSGEALSVEDPELASRYLFNAGQVLLERRQWVEAISALTAAEDLSDVYADEPELFRTRAQARWWAGDTALALADYERAWVLGWQTAAGVDALSDALLTAGRYKDALRLINGFESEGGDLGFHAIANALILGDVIRLTAVEEQVRVGLTSEEEADARVLSDTKTIRDLLRTKDALTPSLLLRLCELEQTVAPGVDMMAAMHTGSPLLWPRPIVLVKISGAGKPLIQQLTRAALTWSDGFLEAFAGFVEAARKLGADLDAEVDSEVNWDELISWVYEAAANFDPFRKAGLRPLGLSMP